MLIPFFFWEDFMIALKIAEVKDFMNKLLCQDVFDHFLIQEAVSSQQMYPAISTARCKKTSTPWKNSKNRISPGFSLFRMVFCAVPAST